MESQAKRVSDGRRFVEEASERGTSTVILPPRRLRRQGSVRSPHYQVTASWSGVGAAARQRTAATSPAVAGEPGRPSRRPGSVVVVAITWVPDGTSGRPSPSLSKPFGGLA